MHISPVLGMILHEIERDAAERRGDDALPISRTACDIIGVFPLEPVRVSVSTPPGITLLAVVIPVAVLLVLWPAKPEREEETS